MYDPLLMQILQSGSELETDRFGLVFLELEVSLFQKGRQVTSSCSFHYDINVSLGLTRINQSYNAIILTHGHYLNFLPVSLKLFLRLLVLRNHFDRYLFLRCFMSGRLHNTRIFGIVRN